MPPPRVPTLTSVTGAGSVAAGQYRYVITFTNLAGHESPPSPILSVTVSSGSSTVNLGIPTFVSSANFVSGSNQFTVNDTISSKDFLRVGMKLKASTQIPAGTYIESIASGSGGAITMSADALADGTAAGFSDDQIDKINIYRLDVNVTTKFLFVNSVNYGTSSFADSSATTSLGAEIKTSDCAQIPDRISNLSINQSGTLVVTSDRDIIYFSLANALGSNPGLYKPAQTIKSPTLVSATIYALDRFFFFTPDRNFSMFLDNALDGIPVLKYIENSEPCSSSDFVYPVEYNSRVYWNTSNGILSTNGESIQSETKYVFTLQENRAFRNCYGAVSVNDALYFYLPGPDLVPGLISTPGLTKRFIYRYTQEFGWSKIAETPPITNSSIDENGTIHQSLTGIAFTRNYDPAKFDAYELVDAGYATFVDSRIDIRRTTGVYWTGEWTGEKHSALKKFRKISALFTGAIEIEVYVDGVALPSKLTANNGTAPKRISWWLPSGTKGRAISLRVERLAAAYSIIEELGVWVGEQRGEMP